MADSVIQDYVKPNSEEPSDDLETKREALAIIATLGTTKEWICEKLSLENVKRLPDKDVEKYYLRYQSVLGCVTVSSRSVSGCDLSPITKRFVDPTQIASIGHDAIAYLIN